MDFLRKHLVLAASLAIVVTCVGLYFFLTRPVMVKRQKLVRVMEGEIDKLRGYRRDPPSPEKIEKLSREKEMLENQYEEVKKVSNFSPRVPLPPSPGPLQLYFGKQMESVEDDLRRLREETGVVFPARLGFGKKKSPESKEELSTLLSQLASAKELVLIVIKAGVSNISDFNPLPLAPDRFMRVSNKPLLEEVEFELVVRADILTLTKLLYQVANGPHFFVVESLEINSVVGERTRAPRPGGERRRGKIPSEALPEEGIGEGEKPAGEVELEARLIISTRLLVEQSNKKIVSAKQARLN